jgi:hypothetical protein
MVQTTVSGCQTGAVLLLQVVPSIILSVISAVLGVVQLFLMGTADVLEPGVKALLALTETSKDTVRDCYLVHCHGNTSFAQEHGCQGLLTKS